MVRHTLYLFYCFSLLLVTAVHGEQQPPSVELLEYLADLDNNDEEWIDPLQMRDLAINQIDEPNGDKGNE